jgi:hypothetical protein
MVSEFSEKQKIFIASQGVLRFNSLTPDGQGISLLKEKFVQHREKFKLNDSIVIVKLEPSKIMNWFL